MLTPKHSGGGLRNYFGNGSDGHIRVTATGALQSFDGTTWTAIPGWELNAADRYAPDAHAEPAVTIPSIEDGDMVVVNALSLTVDSGVTLTTKYRCRGLLVYTQRDAEINGTLSMTARGCHANPADNSDPAHTPVPPSDGGVVPAEGLIIRRLARGHADTHTGPLLDGCGLDAVNAETNQPEVTGNGIVLAIPRVGGAGAARQNPPGDKNDLLGIVGGSPGNAPGGGGGGGSFEHSYSTQAYTGSGGAGTCFGGGAGGGGVYVWPGGSGSASAEDGADYCGPGGVGDDFERPRNYGGGQGAGNPPDGVGGLVALLVGGSYSGGGTLSANGSPGGLGDYDTSGGGGSGGGAVLVLSVNASFSGTLSATGGLGGADGTSSAGGAGGDGAVIGPIQIDPA